MSTPVAALAGAGVGLGLLLVFQGLRRPRLALADLLARVAAPPGQVPAEAARSWGSKIALALAKAFGLERLLTDTLRRDLRSVERGPDDLLVQSLLAAGGLGLVPGALAGLALLGALPVPFGVPAAAIVVCAAVGAVLPGLQVHRQAEKRRRGFRHALSAYLNLVALNVSAGRGVERALHESAKVGQGPAFLAIRQALDRASVTRQSSWAGLARLGEDIGVDDLRELAAAISLAGQSGAKVKESLTAKAATLRKRGLADMKAAAKSANEQMVVPVVLLVVGFIVFIGYPAVYRVMHAL